MEIIRQNNDNVKVKLISANPSFLMFPTALFTVGQQFKWKARFLVGMGYLYALCFNGNVARTTVRELMKVMGTKNPYRVYELLDQIETLNRATVAEAEAVKAGHFINIKKGRRGGAEVELIMPQDLSYLVPENKFFPVPKITFILPLSPQAKAIYLLFYYLKNRESQTVEASYREIAEVLRITKNKIKDYIQELRNFKLLAFQGSSRYFLRRYKFWDSQLFLKIREIYGEHHPFLKEWKIEKTSNRARNLPDLKCCHRGTGNVVIEGQEEKKCCHRGTGNVVIEGHQNPEEQSDTKSNQPSTTSIYTTSKRITTSNNNIYNGDGNLQKLFKKSEKDRQRERKEESNKNNANSENNVQSKNGLRRKKKIAPELAKIRSRLKAVGKELCSGRYRNFYDSLSEGLYSKRLREIYGPEWKTLAVMFEMLDRQWHSSERRFSHGYNRTSIKNVNGFLISMSEGRASFDDFFRTFCEVFGFRTSGSSDLEAFKSFMRERMKEHEFKAWIEDGVSSVDADAGVVVLKDRIIRDFVEKHYSRLFEQFFGGQVRLEC